MATITVFESVTLDGLLRAPRRPDEATYVVSRLRAIPTPTGVVVGQYAVR